MRQYCLFLLLALAGCAADPLEVQTTTLDEPASPDGMEAFTPAQTTLAEGEELTLFDDIHGDLRMKFSVRPTEEAAFVLNLQDRHPVRFRAGTQGQGRDTTEAVYLLDANRWNDIELAFQAPPQDGADALLVSVYLDGNLATYGTDLMVADDPPAALTKLYVQAGRIEIDDVRYATSIGQGSYLTRDGEVVLQLPAWNYDYYDLPDNTDNVADFDALTPAKTGTIARMDLEAIREKNTDYAIRFTGDLDVPRAGTYNFIVTTPANTRLYVNDREVVNSPKEEFMHDATGAIELEEGTVPIRFEWIQNGGWNHVELAYEGPGGSSGHINDMDDGVNITRPTTGGQMPVETDGEPYILRSFMLFPQPRVYAISDKRTHVASVGEADGPHYAVDLQTGALLATWRGDFVDVYEMWHDRGEPQIAKPLAPVIAFDGRPQWHTDDGNWPSAGTPEERFAGEVDHDVRHDRYELDEAGRPTFHYRVGSRKVSDKITPTDGGLERELRYTEGTDGLYTVLASARRITETGPGEFELRGPGAKLTVLENEGNTLHLQRSGNGERLLSRVEPGGRVRALLAW